jgi:hypothetical protein
MVPGNTAALQGGGLLPSNSSSTNLPSTGWVPANPNLANSSTASSGRPTNGTGTPTGFNSGFIAGNTLGNNPQILPSNNAPGYSSASSGTIPTSNNTIYPTTNQPSGPPSFSQTGIGHGGFGHHSQVAGNPTLIANNSKPSGGSGSLAFDEDIGSSLSEKLEEKTANANEDANKSRWENVLQVLFILSLVVNFYLGVLMHKLALRYRTLLSSVRATTVPA